jgi:hydrogenase maturation protease
MKKIAVFGIGNVLIGDDAAGPTIVTMLDALWEFPEGVVIEDIGTPSLDLAGRLAEFDAAILVDAVSAKAEPGATRTYTIDQILKHPPGLRLSPHDPSLKETLLTVQFLGDGPQDIVLVGVVPQSLDQFGLTDAVREAIPHAMDAVLAQLERLGVHASLRSEPRNLRPWWQAA